MGFPIEKRGREGSQVRYISTRGSPDSKSFSECLALGLASDGGLFVPEKFPLFKIEDFSGESLLPDFAARLLKPFTAGSSLESKIGEITNLALNFPIPLKFLKSSPQIAVLELFHGPTAAFKDVGARFLAQCQGHLKTEATIIVATSGDTGGAVASAFSEIPGQKVVILYPKGKISARQEKQLTNHGPQIRAFAVSGSFDDCQRVVKEALADSTLSSLHHLMSANSISIGRLLPQMAYHAQASLLYFQKTGHQPTVIVPTGNLGNAVAALWAKRAGFPIGHVVLATNANRTLQDYFETGRYSVHSTVPTLANAMDVSNPSNFERLLNLYPKLDFLKKDVTSISVSDDEISEAIGRGPKNYGEIWCPHTATAVVALEKLQIERGIVCATAHPAKFETIVEPLIGQEIAVPTALARTLLGSSVSTDLEPTLTALAQALKSGT